MVDVLKIESLRRLDLNCTRGNQNMRTEFSNNSGAPSYKLNPQL
jgi:hypothetical protein